MGLAPEEITVIARAVLAQSHPSVFLTGVSASEGGSNRVELLISLEGCHPKLLNFDRVDRQRFEEDFRLQLRNALDEHIL